MSGPASASARAFHVKPLVPVVDRRQRSEVALDGLREVVVIRLHDPQVRLAHFSRAPDVGLEAGAPGKTRPLGAGEQHNGGGKEDDGDQAHAHRIGALHRLGDGGFIGDPDRLPAMSKRALLLLVAALAAGCGSSSSGTPTVTQGTTTTNTGQVSPPPTAVTVFREQDGKLHAEVSRVPHTTAVATSALGVLGLAAPLTIAAGTAHVALDHASASEIAEIVYTLTQFPSIKRVDVAGRTGLTRADFAAYLPPILVDSPGDGAEVPLTIRVTGSASVFEATLVVELVRDGKVLDKQSVTASEGAPGRGTFATTLRAPSPGAATVSAFAPSAENGLPQHQVDMAVTVKP